MCTERLPTCAPGTKCPLVSSHPVGKRRMAPLSFTISVGCCIIVLGDLDMRCRLSFVLIYVSLLLLVGCGKNFSISHQTTPSLLTPRPMAVRLRPGPMEPSALLRAGVRLGGSPCRGTSPCFPHTIQAGPGGLSPGLMALFG